MKKLILLLLAAAATPTVSMAAPTVNANLATPREANGIDLGCIYGDQRGTKYPTTEYLPGTHERVMYNISRCTGGFILGTNTDTWKTWRAEILYDGSMKGTDEAGDAWRYDRAAKLYTNLSTGRTCETTSLQRVCAP